MSGGFSVTEYDRIRDGCQRSADVIVPLVVSYLPRIPSRVVDVGCGEGAFARKFADMGVADVIGIDAHRSRHFPVPGFIEWDLTTPLPDLGRAYLVVCLEVAEHLPFERGPGLVDDLCNLASLVLWSAAIPGQGGHQHINEQWLSYWAGLFAARNFWPMGHFREQIWDDTRVEPWYRQNLMMFAESSIGGGVPHPMLDVVHPDIFGWRVAEAR